MARSTFNSIEKIIPKALIDSDVDYEGMQIIFPISKLNTASSNIFSFCQSLLNGINWSLKVKMLLALISSKKNILKFKRPTANNIFGCHNLKGIKYLARVRLGLSHLYEHKFKNNFKDTLNPFCTCSSDVENTCHFLLDCPNFLTERNTLLNKITNIDSNIS